MAHATPSKDCLIHCTDDITTVNTLRYIDSWKSLLVAAETREYFCQFLNIEMWMVFLLLLTTRNVEKYLQ